MQSSLSFYTAVNDYLYFLNKKYPQKAILKIIGDRYKLLGVERSILYRGVSAEKESNYRSGKLIDEKLAQNQVLQIDGFNQILTIASYLNGNSVFISTDGLLRDASEIHGKILRTELLSRCIGLLLKYCSHLFLDQLVFYIDLQVSNHEKIEKILADDLSKFEMALKIVLSNQVDRELKTVTNGILATSDSQVIDKTSVPVFDLAYFVLKFHFNPEFMSLKTLLPDKL